MPATGESMNLPSAAGDSARTVLLLSALATALLPACRAPGRHPADADMVLVNGRVLTLDEARPEAQALAVRGGHIAAVGDDEEILGLAGAVTRRIDLAGRRVLPGLIDAHGHLRSLGEQLAGLDLRGVESPEEVARRVREAAGRAKAGEWIHGIGWDENLWLRRALPDHRLLSEAAPGHPVWLLRIDWHTGWANRAALAAAGVTRATPDPEGGRILRDARGEPNGLLVGSALDLMARARGAPSREQIKTWLRLALRRCAEVGLTGVHDAADDPEEVAAFRELADEDALPIRVYLMWKAYEGRRADPLLEQPIFVDYRDRLTLRAVKLLIDGTMGSRGAVFFEEYSDEPGNRGFISTPPEEIRRVTELALRRGYQVATHGIGDRGIHLIAGAYEQALAAAPVPDPRLRIEHLQCVRREDLPRLARLGVIASMQPSHATSEQGWSEKRVGPERARGLYALRWVREAGIRIAGGSDFPVDDESPLAGIHAAVTRQDRRGNPPGGWHSEQALTLPEALRAYTIDAAYAAFEDDRKGRIAPGFWADLTVLERDILAMPASEISGAGVALTLVGGRVAFEAGAAFATTGAPAADSAPRRAVAR
jgi:hypothetical protein